MKDLSTIALSYGTDKCPQIKHHFTWFYQAHFSGFEDRVKKVLEIGIGYPAIMDLEHYKIGASLYMWRDFFPNADIYGIDIEPKVIFQDERIHTCLCDQHKKWELEMLIDDINGDLDLVIDDGDHRPHSQVKTCLDLMPLLQKDVLYVIEDVGHPRIMRELGQYSAQVINFEQRKYSDDRLVVVRHKDGKCFGNYPL